MKALLLSGGAGTRLRPITHTRAKQLVPVANKPILFYAIESIAAAGITQVGIITGETGAEVMAAVGDGSKWGIEVTWIPQEAPLGLAHAVLIAEDFLADEDFVMYLGDNLLESGVSELVESFRRSRQDFMAPTLETSAGAVAAAQILLAHVDDPRRFGVAELDGAGVVVKLVEKPQDPRSDLALVGVYLFDRNIHRAVRAIAPSPRGELEITDAIQWLIDQGLRVDSQVISGWWIDTGKLTPLLEANRILLERLQTEISGEVDGGSQIEGRVVVEKGARVVNSRVRGPAVIGAGSVISDSYIGPFSAIGADCRIERSEIEHSVILPSCEVKGAGRISDSLLGYNVTVTRSGERPAATRLMVGDHGQVDLA